MGDSPGANGTVTRRRFLTLSLMGAAALVSCQPAAPALPAGASPAAAPKPTAVPQGPAAAKPAEVTSITLGMANLSPNLDPHTTSGPHNLMAWRQIFDSLTDIDLAGKVQPSLVVSWKSVDPTTWEFKLRPGVKFQNGEPLNSEAIKYNFDRVFDPKNQFAFLMGRFPSVDRVSPVDAETLRITTKIPDPILPGRLSALYVVPPKQVEQAGKDFASNPIGTGPYKVTRYETKQLLALEAVSGSWRGTPNLKTVRILNMDETATRLAALRSGDADLAFDLPADSVDQLKSQGFEVPSTPQSRMFVFDIDMLHGGPLADKRVRQAFNHAVNKEAVLAGLLRNNGKLSNGQLLADNGFGYNPDLKPYPYDVDRAKALLDQAGASSGLTVKITVTEGQVAIAEAVAGYLDKVGVKTTGMEQLDLATQIERHNKGGRGPLYEWLPNYGPVMDADFSFQWYTNAVPEPARRMDDPRTNDLFKQSRVELDPTKRLKILQEMVVIFREEAPAIFMFLPLWLYGMSKKVQGFKPRSDAAILFDQLTLLK